MWSTKPEADPLREKKPRAMWSKLQEQRLCPKVVDGDIVITNPSGLHGIFQLSYISHLCDTGLTQCSTCLTKPKASWRNPRALPSMEASSVQPSVGERSTSHTVYKTYRNHPSDPRDPITAIDVLNGHLRKWKWWASGRKWPERRAARLRPCTSGKEIPQLPWGILKKEKEPMKTLKDFPTLLHSCFLWS